MSESAADLKKLESVAGRSIWLVRRNLRERGASASWSHSKFTPVAEDCDGSTLVAVLKRTARLQDWMANPDIKRLLPLLHKLPTAPRLHTQVTEELQSPNGSIAVVARLIAQDPLMSAKLLQVANSAFFGMAHEVTDTTEAVMVLGAERIRSLILLAGVFSQYGGAKCPGFSPEPLWGHSVQVGAFARAITLAETRDGRTAEAAFTAGLLHDVGKLVLAANVPEKYESIRRAQAARKCSQREAEMEILGTTHAEVGACLMATWALPLRILEAIAWHHEPRLSDDRGFSLLAAVHSANVFAQENGDGGGGIGPRDCINVSYLLRIGLGDCRNRWREYCGMAAQPEELTPEEQLRRRREAKEN